MNRIGVFGLALALLPAAVVAAATAKPLVQVFYEDGGRAAIVVNGTLVGTATHFTPPEGAKSFPVVAGDYTSKPQLMQLVKPLTAKDLLANPRRIGQNRADEPDDPDAPGTEPPATPDKPVTDPPLPGTNSDPTHPEPKPGAPYNEPPPKPQGPLPVPGCTEVPGCMPGVFKRQNRVTHYYPEIRDANVYRVTAGTVQKVIETTDKTQHN